MNMDLISEDTLRRLTLVRYLNFTAVELSLKPEPQCAYSILLFHDCIEHFMILAWEIFDISVPTNVTFMQYIDILNDALSDNIKLSGKESMRRLNRVRRELKHRGITPSKEMVNSLRNNVEQFLVENTPILFKINYHDISLLNLLKYVDVKESLTEAELEKNDGNIDEARQSFAIAFDQLVNKFRGIDYKGAMFRSPRFSSTFINLPADRSMAESMSRFIEEMAREIGVIQESIFLLSLGVEYSHFIKFKSITPMVYRTYKGEYHVNWPAYIRDQDFSDNDYDFCYTFIMDCALRIQDLDLLYEE